ncbi:hypothetical protein BC940DRAFT_309094 [Gongronella butleri]|nr:hypothetical protein BC940DRAFT_309094 [Gongronella butleri]
MPEHKEKPVVQESGSKDLYAMIGGLPPISFVKPTYKTEMKKPRVWSERPFLHPARNDALILKHWVREDRQLEDQDYHFAKFNRVIDIIEYTDDDYEKNLTDTDWSKEETDYLFKLCRQFDLRFPVIADRYNFGSTARTMEDLKDRYYSVNRKLIKVRGGLREDVYDNRLDRQTLLQYYSFDKNKEAERKQALLRLYQRTPEQVEEEELLFLEARRMEENKEALTIQREQLYSTLHLEQAQQVPATPLTPLTASTTTPHTAATTPTNGIPSSNASNAAIANPGGIGITGGTSSAAHDKKKRKDDTLKKVRRISNSSSLEDLLPPPPEKKDKLIPGVYVRSQKLPGVKSTMQAKVLRAMADIGIGARPIMPTEQVCYKYEHLQNSVLTLLEIRKLAEKLDLDSRVPKSSPDASAAAGRKHALSSSSSGRGGGGDNRRRKLG